MVIETTAQTILRMSTEKACAAYELNKDLEKYTSGYEKFPVLSSTCLTTRLLPLLPALCSLANRPSLIASRDHDKSGLSHYAQAKYAVFRRSPYFVDTHQRISAEI